MQIGPLRQKPGEPVSTQILPGSAGSWPKEIPCRRWGKKHPLQVHERKNLLFAKYALLFPPYPSLGPPPRLGLGLQNVGLF